MTNFNWWHWHTEPELIGLLVLVGWIYALAVGPLRPILAPGQPFPRARAIAFYSGLVFLYLAIGSPLDLMAEVYLFTAHMIQHVLLIYPVAILLVLGLPGWLTDFAFRLTPFRLFWRGLSHPLVAGFLFFATLSIWHLPEFYDLALRVRWVHNLEHFTMFLVSFLVWWNVFTASQTVPRLSYGLQMLFVFLLGLAKIPVSAYLIFSREVLYPTYELAPRLFALSALEDQILGGSIMTFLAKFGSIIIIAYSFTQWSKENRRQTDHRLSIDSLR